MRLLETDSSTICATATAPGLGGIAVVRVSGVQAEQIVRKLCPFLPPSLESHRVYYGWIKAADSHHTIDEVLVSYFTEGRSFTGEHTFEISSHGSDLICEEILRNLCQSGARMAQRGEFTYRAFMNGRVDLVQAEGVLDLIESRSQRASQLALRQLQGRFSLKLKSVLDQLTWILAHLEANIDFSSEDIEVVAPRDLARKTEGLIAEVREILASYHQGSIIRNGYQVALVGRPNAGKSSLLNALIGEEKAIVTPIPGTTRDFVEAQISLNGIRVSLIDTAGLRITDDPVEKIGVQRSLEKIRDAELVLYVVDSNEGLVADEAPFLEKIPWQKSVILRNKADLAKDPKEVAGAPASIYIDVSAKTGMGLNELKCLIQHRIQKEVPEDSTLLSNVRHFEGLTAVLSSLQESRALMGQESSPDLIALELQQALKALHEILGLVFDDQVMDRVFKEFCLGK